MRYKQELLSWARYRANQAIAARSGGQSRISKPQDIIESIGFSGA
jgi:hypothetical protein